MPDNVPIPVFVIPSSLTFYAADQTTHKQVLTLFNPYDFAVRFQVLCSSHEKNKYLVVDPEGSINSHCCVDIVVRHNAVTNQNIGQSDKFRVQMFEVSSNRVIGRKDITAELLAGEPDRASTPSREMFLQLPPPTSPQNLVQNSLQRRQPPVRPGAPNGMVVTVAVLCCATLLLPSQGEPSTFLPDYLKPTITIKHVVCYVLGLLTMVVFRPG